jgi:stage II sporulation protein Q
MDKEKIQNPNQNANEQTSQENIKRSPMQSSWKRYLSKKWVFPAIYLGAAALILALIFMFQDPSRYAVDKEDVLPDLVNNKDLEGSVANGEGSIPVTTPEESFDWPVDSKAGVTIARGFYDDAAPEEEQVKAVVEYAGKYYTNAGIDMHVDGKETFDVFAAASGEVVRADKDPVVGYVVHVQHDNNRMSVYEGLEKIDVAVGDLVKKGDVLGKAGRSDFRKDLGVHVHFEIHENGKPVNPLTLLPEQN